MADVCADMSRFHGVRDISRMRSADFFAAAARLPYYQGAVTLAMQRAAEQEKARRASRPLTLQELRGGEYSARDGMAPLFDFG